MDSFKVGAGQGPAAGLGAIGSILGFVGNMQAGRASKAAGERQKAAAMFEAAQLEQAAGQAVAGSQRDRANEARRTALLISKGVAAAAASGGGVTDPTVEGLLSDISGEGAYRAALALYQGEEKARQLELGATVRRAEGENAAQWGADRATAYRIGAMSGLASGGASLYGKYGMGGPKKQVSSVTTRGGESIDWDLQ